MLRHNAGDLRRAHAALDRTDDVIAQRRTLYSVAIELMSEVRPGRASAADVLDNPAVRGHLAAALGGQVNFSPARCVPLADLVASGYRTEIGGSPICLASSPVVPAALAGAVSRIGEELRRHGDQVPRPELLTIHDQPAIGTAFRRLVAGVRLAVDTAPEVTLDLLPHLSLFGVLARHASGRLGSASAREFPGLVVMPEPRSALEVAEAVIHEGAHQKFFDLAITHSLLGSQQYEAPVFTPSWAPKGAPGWPIEQSFAAWHAYCCLSVFADTLEKIPDAAIHEDSLLPFAAVRAAEIGAWLLRQGSFLGPDGHALVEALLGSAPRDPSRDEGLDVRTLGITSDDGLPLVVRRCGRKALVARGAQPPDLLWAPADEMYRLLAGERLPGRFE